MAPGIAEPAGERAEQIDAALVMLRRGAELENRIQVLAGYTRPAEAPAARKPRGRARIVAELGAADDATAGVRTDTAGPQIEPVGITPDRAEMPAEIKAAPVPGRQLSIRGGYRK
jgi:hypothetical protein